MVTLHMPIINPFTRQNFDKYLYSEHRWSWWKNFTCKYSVEIEKNTDNPASDEDVAQTVSNALKARIGVKPYQVFVHPDGGLNTRSEHKSKRIIDERKLEYNI